MILRTFSPPAQRIIALGLLLFLVLAVLLFVLLPLATGISENLGLLDRQRDELASAEAIVASPAPRQGLALDPVNWISAADGLVASRALAASLTGLAARRGVELTVNADAAPAVRPPVLLSMPFTARGEQAAVLAFIGDVESGRPLLRFRQLSLKGLEQAALPPGAPVTAIAPQSPNLTEAMTLEAQAPAPAAAGNGTDAAPPPPRVTALQADGVVMALWGGVR